LDTTTRGRPVALGVQFEISDFGFEMGFCPISNLPAHRRALKAGSKGPSMATAPWWRACSMVESGTIVSAKTDGLAFQVQRPILSCRVMDKSGNHLHPNFRCAMRTPYL
jgi:hypothetical protein